MIYNLDVLEFLSQLETNSVHLAFLDPPYNIGVFCKMPDGEYLDWWYFYIPGEGSEPCPEIYYWWELPVMAKEKK